jgi:hypothetical protein
MTIREMKMAQNRIESLLLEMIHDRLITTAPPKPEDLDNEISERYRGYYEGYWDAIEALSNVVDRHNESNDAQAASWLK